MTHMDDTAVLAPVGAEPSAVDRDDDLAAELARAAPRRWWNRGTLVLGATALLLAGFLGGLQVQRHYGTSATAATGRPNGGTGTGGARAGGYGFPGGTGGLPGGAAPTAAAAAGPTTGKVKLVDGTTIYVETADGTVVTVRTGGDTAVRTAKPGKIKDVKAGDTVSVQGATAADGTVTATAVTKNAG
ncbi:hypothetical protein Adi01nite_12670 [Amorphoplanes digitatis]|nr:hypothetical protein Adi01nite_12670 [Actinoplanes digitatis]